MQTLTTTATDLRYFANIIFLQGDEAEPILKGIKRVGEERVLEYLKGWDNGVYEDILPETRAENTNAWVYFTENYLLVYSSAYQYVGLERILTPLEYAAIVH